MADILGCVQRFLPGRDGHGYLPLLGAILLVSQGTIRIVVLCMLNRVDAFLAKMIDLMARDVTSLLQFTN